MSIKPAEILRVDGHEVDITRPRRFCFPKTESRRRFDRYYQRISPWMATPRGRPLALQRFPDGIDRPAFRKQRASYPLDQKVTVQKEGGTVKHVVCDDVATLCIWRIKPASRLMAQRIKLQFPESDDLRSRSVDRRCAAVIDAALLLKAYWMIWSCAYIRATGSRGLHVAVPLNREQDFDAVRAFARSVAEIIVARDPSRYTLEQYKSKRRGRVFIDVNRTAYAQTAVAVYAVRARNGAPVSVPLAWSELRKKGLRPDGLTIRTVFERLDKGDDPWKDFGGTPHRWTRRAGNWSNHMALEEYRKKRSFSVTSEPRGRPRRSNRGSGLFVVQKHDATNLHYDFRFGDPGVLVSWAVPKGPSMNPADKRLAMMTEDHPLEYADFEGVIPRRRIRRGPVMVWDTGAYEASG
jgi:bifunctional non-homologous end joining protein LigD